MSRCIHVSQKNRCVTTDVTADVTTAITVDVTADITTDVTAGIITDVTTDVTTLQLLVKKIVISDKGRLALLM